MSLWSSWASLVAQLVKNPPAMWETWVPFLGWEDTLEEGKASHSSIMGFPDSSVGKESVCNAGDPGSIPGSGRSTGEGIGYPLQHSLVSLVAQLVKNPPAMQETWVEKIPRRRERLPTPVFWPGEFRGLYRPWGRKEAETTKQLSHGQVRS